jgi:hypothetical protein
MKKLLAVAAIAGFLASAPLAHAHPAPVVPSPGPQRPSGGSGGGSIFRLPQRRVEPAPPAEPPAQVQHPQPQETPAPPRREPEQAPKPVDPPAAPPRDAEPSAPRHDVPPPVAPEHSPGSPEVPKATEHPATQHPGLPAPPAGPPAALPHRPDAAEPGSVRKPQPLAAEKDAVDAARAVPLQHVDPIAPPLPPSEKADPIKQAEQISARVPEADRDDRGVVRPHEWTFVDHDVDCRPIFFNPVGTDMTFRYFYRGAYRDVFVPAGANIVLDIVDAAVFPFTAVGGDFVTAGAFTGGGLVPTTYDNVLADVVSADRTVQVGSVQLVGHDDARPAGQQDAMMLDGTTLAYGTVHDPSHVDVAKVQTLPGVGPMDDGTHWVTAALATPLPTSHARDWLLGGAVAALLASLGTIAGVFVRRRRSLAQPAVAYSYDPHEPTQWMNGPYH